MCLELEMLCERKFYKIPCYLGINGMALMKEILDGDLSHRCWLLLLLLTVSILDIQDMHILPSGYRGVQKLSASQNRQSLAFASRSNMAPNGGKK